MEEEPDLLAAGSEVREAPDGLESRPAAEAPEDDLVPEVDLRSLLAHLNPLAIRDIGTIEKGVEHFFLFHQAHLALTRPDQLKFLTPDDLDSLEERNAVRRFSYLRYLDAPGTISLVSVLIRPASLKGEQVAKVRQGCIRGSVASLLEYVARRDERVADLEVKGELSRWVSDRLPKVSADGQALNPDSRADLNRLIENLNALSFENLLEREASPPPEIAIPILRLLCLRPDELKQELALLPELPPLATRAVESRGGRPVLLRLTPDFHVLQPPALQLVQASESGHRNLTSELEWILVLFVQIARRLLLAILPEEESAWIQKSGTSQAARYLEELRRHPSLASAEWSAVPSFLNAYEALLRHVQNLEQLRREFFLGSVVEEMRRQLNMQFEPVLVTAETLQLPEGVAERFERSELFEVVCARVRETGDVLTMEERRREEGQASEGRGVYMLFLANLPQAFIRNRKRRSFLHLFARENGRPEGIYSFLREVSDETSTRELVDEQIALSRAIREWEAEQEKARLKRELAAMGFFARLWRFFLGLFGIHSERRAEAPGVKARTVRQAKGAGASGVLVGPREKRLRIPERVQKAIEFVDRKNRGLIWLDEVESALSSTRYTTDGLGDLLFYDAQGRYEEIRALVQEKRVFIHRNNLNDLNWIEATLDYLENVANPGTHHGLLARHLQTRAEELRA